MPFRPGQTVVHPQHGTAVIDQIEERDFNGTPTRFLVLKAPAADLTVKIPEDRCVDIGIREVIGEAEVADVLSVLGDPAGPQQGHWSSRLKQNQQRIRSGDPVQVAEVLRDLAAKSESKQLSPAEKRLYDKARQMLTGELAVAVEGGPDHVEALIDDALGLTPA